MIHPDDDSEEPRSRFNAPKADQLWYYRSAARAYREAGFTGPLLTELERLVELLEKAAA